MKSDFNRGRISSRQITVGDWSEYRDFCVRIADQEKWSKDDLRDHLHGRDPDVPGNWQDYIEKSGHTLFGLYHDDKIVGQSPIIFRSTMTLFGWDADRDTKAILTEHIIDRDYRSKELADSLYDAQLRYLNDIIKHKGRITAEILQDDKDALEAARDRGFRLLSCQEGDGGVRYQVLEL